MNSSQKRNKTGESVILHHLHRFCAWIYAQILESLIGRVLTGYHPVSETLRESRWYRLIHSRRKRADRPSFRFRQWVSRLFERSFICRLIGAIQHELMHTAIHCYGVFFLFFGCYCVVTYYVIGGLDEQIASASYLFTGSACILIALPMFAAPRSLAAGVRQSTVLRALFIHALGVAEERLAAYGEKGKERYLEALVAAILLGSLTFWCQPHLILLAVLGIVAVLIIFRDPEIGMLLSLAFAPFASLTGRPTLALLALVGITLISYAVKLLCGKRVLRMQAFDWLFLGLFVLILLGGIVSHGGRASLQSAMAYACLGLLYFMVANLVRSQKGVWRVMFALLVSGVGSALLGVWQYTFSRPALQYVDMRLFADLGGRVTALWDNPNVLAEQMALLLPLALTVLLLQRRLLRGFGAALAVAAMGLALIFTWSRGAWLGCLIALLLYVLCLGHKALGYVIVGVLPTVTLLPLLPERVVRRFLSIASHADSSIVYRFNLWRGVGNMLSDHWLTGVGVGERAFCTVYADYALAGIETAPHSHSLYLQLLCSLGVMGLVVFALGLFLWLQRTLEWLKDTKDKTTSLVVLGSLAGIVALLIMGAFDHIWYNYRIYMLFWSVMGLVTAQIRVGEYKAERESGWVDDERTQGEIVLHFR